MSSPAASPRLEREAFRVGGWWVEPRRNRLTRDGVSVRVEPKVMELLVCLAERPGEVLPRALLLEKVWPGVVVGDDALSLSVSKLRKALADDRRRPRFVETIPKTGYRLIAAVHELGGPPPQAGRGPGPRRLRQRWGWAALAGTIALGAAAGWLLRPQRGEVEEAVFLRPRPVTSLPGRERQAALSPDGGRVAYAWATEGGAADIYVKALDSGETLRLTESPAVDASPVWAPDGRRVAFLRYSLEGCSILLAALVGGETRQLAPCGSNSWGELAWSPDGRWLAFPHREAPQGPSGIRLLSPESGEVRALTRPREALAGDHAPAFSPDGEWLSFIRSGSVRQGDLYVVSLAGGEPRRRTFDNRWLWGHTWSPDGEDLLFSSSRLGFFNLWQVGFRRGEPRWLPVTGGESLIAPTVSPRSRRLVYEQWSYDANIRQQSISEQGPAAPATVLLSSSQWDSHPRFSPQGDRIAFTSRRSGELEIWVAAGDGAEPYPLASTGDSFASTFDWSPDGRRIVFSARRDGQVDLYAAELGSRRIRQLTEGPAVELNPRWSDGGGRILFSSDRSGAWQIWEMPAAGAPAVQVSRGGGIFAQRTSSGGLFLTRHDADGIWSLDPAGGEETLVTDALDARDWGNWVVSGERIYFVRRRGSAAVLASLSPLDGGAEEGVVIEERVGLERSPVNPSLAVSPDGGRVLYASLDRNESDLKMVELPESPAGGPHPF